MINQVLSFPCRHRLSTVTNADQILVFHEGRIVERGKHSTLLALGGRYKELWDKQTNAEGRGEGGEARE